MSTVSEYSRRYAAPLWGWYLCGFLALALTNWVTLEIPQLAKSIVNRLAEGGDLSTMRGVAWLVIALGILMILIRALSRILIFWPGRKLEAHIKYDLFSKMLSLPQKVILKYGMGDLISRLANDTGQIRVFYAFGLLQVLNISFLLAFTIHKMLSVHMQLTFACLAPLGFMIFIVRYAMPKMHEFSKKNQEAVGRLTNRVTESFVNVHVIQANTAEKTFHDKAQKENVAVYLTNLKLIFIRTLIFPLMSSLASIAQLMVLFYGGNEVIAKRLSIGDIMAFNVYIGLMTFPLTAIGIIIAVYQRAKTAIERVSAVADESSETFSTHLMPLNQSGHGAASEMKTLKSPPSPLASSGPSIVSPQLVVRGLNFFYPRSNDQAETDGSPFHLRDVNLNVERGKRIGIFGVIGSGKTTLFHLLTRVYDPPPGAIFWEGRDITQFAPQSLRQEIGYALQTVHLFSASIRENLCFGLPSVDDDEIRKACRHAQILNEIDALSNGFATAIGEKGVRLSGGQKQRLALARMFLHRPKLIILDDVISALDHKTESALMKYIYSTQMTMIISSHRGASLKFCDEVLIIEDGKIVDRGDFDRLAYKYPVLNKDL